mmetsp:Transcript_30279/g.85397  ORF Transcript_30279/g.85397 Transcript_30279/m.85397 type:complete len:265 (-) Transcript_30279:188-982(-)|eukprot:CAMPEP_0179259698 /NCGR_PEP_ID=MMETSP0797-20121207/25958_1 /TAXON_ID=47934 /ORGANISM="Dinophysis acuminata, Strain DAEP01" /LENGTH=264 /DNA_ID=CAMNT_0020967755 /DNA_START=78 /DNA_END=872 /DNA_ORIENTATION=+
MPVVPIDGTDIYFEDSDAGGRRNLPALVFLHGAMGNTMAWWQQVPVLSRLFRCITYDIRGYGRSPDPTRDSMAHLISDLEGLIDHLGPAAVSFVAQSMGGRAALGYAARHPGRVEALVMADNWGGFEWPEQAERAKGFTIPEGHPRGVSRSFPEAQPSLWFLWRQIGALNPEPRPRLEGPTPGGPTLEAVRALQVPVLCLVGDDDVIFPPPLIKAFADELRNAEYVQVPGCGHSAYFEKATEFNDIVMAFLRKHVSACATDSPS